MVATRESAALAEVLIRQTCAKQGIAAYELATHAYRGSSMTSKPAAFLLADLGVTQSHSRPHVSDDNPFSESQFKTLKYRPDFPGRFDSIEAARRHGRPSSPGITTIITTAGWACTLPPTSTTAPPRQSVTSAPPCSPTHTGRIPNGYPQAARAATPAHRLVDQPTRPARGGHSVNTARVPHSG